MHAVCILYRLAVNHYSLEDSLSILILVHFEKVLEEWNKGELDSFLIEISRDILRFKDKDGKYLLEKIRDTAGQVSHIGE